MNIAQVIYNLLISVLFVAIVCAAGALAFAFTPMVLLIVGLLVIILPVANWFTGHKHK